MNNPAEACPVALAYRGHSTRSNKPKMRQPYFGGPAETGKDRTLGRMKFNQERQDDFSLRVA